MRICLVQHVGSTSSCVVKIPSFTHPFTNPTPVRSILAFRSKGRLDQTN